MPKWIRWKGFYLAAFLLLVPVIYVKWGFDAHLKHELSEAASRYNGAQVNIESLRTNFLNRTIEVKRIQLGHSALPMKNWLELDSVNVHFELEPLLRKKLIFSKMDIEGVHEFTNRETSGLLPVETHLGPNSLNFFDRVASGLYTSARSKLADNPLQQVGQLSGGIDMHAKVEMVHNELKTLQTLKQHRRDLETLAAKIKLKSEELPTQASLIALRKKVEAAASPAVLMGRNLASDTEWHAILQEIDSKSAISETVLQQFQKDIDTVRTTNENLEPLLKEDVQFLRTRLKVPTMEVNDITPAVFGPAILNTLERVTYWVDFARRQMPLAAQSEGQMFVVQEGRGNTRVHFGNEDNLPTFLLRKVVIHSKTGEDATLGDVTGEIEGITSDPSIYGKPLTANLSLDFPKYGLKSAKLKFTIDHTKATPLDEAHLEIASFPIEDWTLAESNDLRFKVAHAKGTLSAEGKMGDNGIDIQWKLNLNEVDYGVYSRYKMVEDTMKNLVANHYSFQCNGRAEGQLNEIDFKIESDFGKTLAEGLRREFRSQLAAIEENLRSNVLEQVGPQRQLVTDELKEIDAQLAPYHDATKQIQAIRQLADNTMKGHEDDQRRASSRHRRK